MNVKERVTIGAMRILSMEDIVTRVTVFVMASHNVMMELMNQHPAVSLALKRTIGMFDHIFPS